LHRTNSSLVAAQTSLDIAIDGLTSQLMSVLPVLAQFLKSKRLMPSPMMANVTKVTLTTMMVILKKKRETIY
jgi:hypothetical protein